MKMLVICRKKFTKYCRNYVKQFVRKDSLIDIRCTIQGSTAMDPNISCNENHLIPGLNSTALQREAVTIFP